MLAIIVLRLFALISKLGIGYSTYKASILRNILKDQDILENKIVLLLIATTLVFSSIMYFNAVLLASFIGANPEYIKLNSFFVLPMDFFI